LNASTVSGAFNVTAATLTVNGAVSTGAATFTGSTSYTQNDFDISSGANNITVITDAITIGSNTGNNAFVTTGALILRPSTTNLAMSLAGSSPFDLSASEITNLSGGVTGAGTIAI